MGKYIQVIKNSFARNIVYRTNVFAMLFSDLIVFGVFFYFWSSVYREGNQVGTYTLASIVSYYLAVNLFGLLIKGDDIAWKVGDEIRLGQITPSLLKPIHYILYKFSQSIGGLILRLVVVSFSITAITLLFSQYIDFPNDPLRIVYFLISLVLGWIIYFFLFLCVGISTFWIGMAKGLNFSLSVIAGFLEGSIIPIDLLGSGFLKISNFLPFKYVIFMPVSIYLGRVSLSISQLLIPFCWAVFFILLSFILFKSGLKRYEAFGA